MTPDELQQQAQELVTQLLVSKYVILQGTSAANVGTQVEKLDAKVEMYKAEIIMRLVTVDIQILLLEMQRERDQLPEDVFSRVHDYLQLHVQQNAPDMDLEALGARIQRDLVLPPPAQPAAQPAQPAALPAQPPAQPAAQPAAPPAQPAQFATVDAALQELEVFAWGNGETRVTGEHRDDPYGLADVQPADVAPIIAGEDNLGLPDLGERGEPEDPHALARYIDDLMEKPVEEFLFSAEADRAIEDALRL